MANPLEFAKAHPVGVGIALVVIIGGFFILSSAGGGATVAADTGSGTDVAGSAALQAAQAQYSAMALQSNNEKDVALANTAAQLSIAGLSKDVALANTDSQTQLGLANYASQTQLGLASVQAQKDVQTLGSTLAAQIQGQQIKADSDATTEMYSSISAQLASNAQISAAQIAAASQTSAAQIASNQAITTASIKANTKKPGLFSFLFG